MALIVFKVARECSVSMDAGDMVPMTATPASSRTKHSARTRVSGLFRYGTCTFEFLAPENFSRRKRTHSFSAYKLALISAVSFRCFSL